jgi:two-component system, chemotaxis family, chemotaxis protein CheY
MKPLTALVVDDSLMARALARAVLEEAAVQQGIALTVHEAQSGADALRLMTVHRCQLLVIDLHMPDVHGFDVLTFWARQRRENDRALMVTSTVVEADARKAKQAGADHFEEKPLTVGAANDVLRHWIDAP